METKVTYFENSGELNTDETLALAKRRAAELGIKTVVVASTRGETARKAVDVFKGMRIVVVTHTYGFREPNSDEFPEEIRKLVEGKGGKILTTTHAFGGINNAFQPPMPRPPQPVAGPQPQVTGGPPAGGPPPNMQRSTLPAEVIAYTLGLFSRGMKVAVEIVLMAADAGLIRTDEEVVAIAGSGRGADTAIVVQPANANRFFDLKIKEIICKPRN